MKKALIIGGTSGIIQHTIEKLIEDDYMLVLTGIENDILKRFKDTYPSIVTKFLDLKEPNPSEIVKNIIQELGGLSLLIYSAGIGFLYKELGYKVENEGNKVNVIAFTEIIDYCYTFFEKQKYGHIIGITSFSGLRSFKLSPAYSGGKSYQIKYLEGLSMSSKYTYITDIRPGFVHTNMIKGKRTFWVLSKEKAGKRIYHAIKKHKKVTYLSKRFYYLSLIIKILPRSILKKF